MIPAIFRSSALAERIAPKPLKSLAAFRATAAARFSSAGAVEFVSRVPALQLKARLGREIVARKRAVAERAPVQTPLALA